MRAYFALGGDFDPSEVTHALGVEPTRTWRRGDPRVPGAALTCEADGWAYGTRDVEGLDLPGLVTEILDRLHPLAGRLEPLRRSLGLEARLQCVAYVTEQAPLAHFSREVLAKIVDLGASLDVDVVLSTGDRP